MRKLVSFPTASICLSGCAGNADDVRGAETMPEMAAQVAARSPPAAQPQPIRNGPRPEQRSPDVTIGTARSHVHIQVDFAVREK